LYSKPFENFIAPYTTEYRYKDIQTAMETSQWEQTVGTIILSEVFEEKNSDGITHKPLIEYTYTVHGTDYTGKTIYIGIWISINSKFSAKRFVSKYPVNQQVSVYYKPTQPQFSVLEPGVNKFTLYTLISGIFPVLLGILLYYQEIKKVYFSIPDFLEYCFIVIFAFMAIIWVCMSISLK
jgi:hypothetical protein